jgi:hypothetical protein
MPVLLHAHLVALAGFEPARDIGFKPTGSAVLLQGRTLMADLPIVHLRAPRYSGQPSHGLPTVAHALVGKRERKLAEAERIELPTPFGATVFETA